MRQIQELAISGFGVYGCGVGKLGDLVVAQHSHKERGYHSMKREVMQSICEAPTVG